MFPISSTDAAVGHCAVTQAEGCPLWGRGTGLEAETHQARNAALPSARNPRGETHAARCGVGSAGAAGTGARCRRRAGGGQLLGRGEGSA